MIAYVAEWKWGRDVCCGDIDAAAISYVEYGDVAALCRRRGSIEWDN